MILSPVLHFPPKSHIYILTKRNFNNSDKQTESKSNKKPRLSNNKSSKKLIRET